jgi:hypothetical protein
LLPGIPPLGIFSKIEEAMKRTAWGSATLSVSNLMPETPGGNVVHETPLFMRFPRTLSFVTMRLWVTQSQQENVGFPQFSWVFLGI